MRLLSFTTVSSSLAFGLLVYGLSIAALTIPWAQRNAFYANKVNPAQWGQNLSDVEQFGFLHHQVQPFTVTTPDNVTLHAWHIIPIHLYLKHERALKSQEHFGVKTSDQALKTVGFKLLQEPDAYVVVSFHGNAAHLGSAQRPATYQQMLGLSTPQRPIHVIAFDYRGFGLSTGQPTEEGIIRDGMTLGSFLTGLGSSKSKKQPSLQIPTSRIVLLGQSLGTATATALYHRWSLEHHLSPFRGLVLMASFSSVPTLLRSYSLKGISPPMLSPLNKLPQLQQYVISTIADTWATDRRIGEIVAAANTGLNLTILHARNDGDIPWREGWRNWESAMAATGGKGRLLKGSDHEGDENLEVLQWESDDSRKRLRWERIMYGGHNRVATSEQVRLAVLRILDGMQR